MPLLAVGYMLDAQRLNRRRKIIIWLHTSFDISIGIWLVLEIYVFPEIKNDYNKKGIFTNRFLNSWYAMWAFHHVPVVLASFHDLFVHAVDAKSLKGMPLLTLQHIEAELLRGGGYEAS
ncbi:hypothetical protein MNBD_BACTEROID01-2881 [hydrothermal vent metagenome]|uniref:Uncharacterized protein n=1 Tax=hydrothermal vent metagenome TaxID=652676 RepID=A0A3B0U379_9ZZZZ